MQLHCNQVNTKRHYVGGVVLRSVASGVVCCRRYAQLGGNRRLGFCIRIASERSESYWIGCVASDSSDLDAAQPTQGWWTSHTRRPFWSRFDKTADMRSDQAFDLIAGGVRPARTRGAGLPCLLAGRWNVLVALTTTLAGVANCLPWWVSSLPSPNLRLALGLPPVFVIVLVVVGAGTRGMVVEEASGLSADIVAPVRRGGGVKAPGTGALSSR